MRTLLAFMPAELTIFLVVGAAFALMFGARRIAFALLASVLALAFLPVIAGPVFDALPAWLVVALMIFVILGLVRRVVELLIGKRSTDHMVGALAADWVLGSVKLVWRILLAVLGLRRQRR